jgi:hypothetical protein
LQSVTRNRRRSRRSLSFRRKALNQQVKALTTNLRLKTQAKAKARIRESAVNKKNAEKTPPQIRIKTYPILNVIIAIKRGIMQIYVPNPIRGKKAKINSPKS